MKKFILSLVLLATQAFAVLPSNGAYELDRSGPLQRKYSMGSQLREAQTFGLKGQWSVASQGGAATTSYAFKNEWLSEDITLPKGAIIRECFFDVVQSVTSATSSGKFSLDSNATGDLKAAAFANTFSGRVACIPEGTLSNAVKLTAERTIQLTVGSEALSAGKVNLFLQYVLSE